MTTCNQGIFINTISGGIVNFGGALKIAPVSITNNSGGSGESNSGLDVSENSGLQIPRMSSLCSVEKQQGKKRMISAGQK